jgi:hypothetical protein
MSARFRKSIFILFLLFAVLLVGCQSGGDKPAPAQPSDLEYTQAAETIFAEMTASAPTSTPAPAQLPEIEPTEAQMATEASGPAATLEPLPPTSTPLPTNTPLPTDTPEPTETPLPTDTPEPSNTPTPAEPEFDLVYEDDFAFAQGWPDERGDSFSVRYNLGGYVISVDLRNDVIWSVRSQPFINVRVEVEGMRLSGPRDGTYGVVCRHENGSNYYYFFVGSDGSYGIGKKVAGVMNYLVLEQDTNAVIYTGAATNVVRADCIGNTLTLYANDQQLATVDDEEFTAGAVGMAAGTQSTTGYEVLFDNIKIYEPTQ